MAILIIVTNRNVIRQFNVNGPVTTIGRSDVNHVTLDFNHVSRHHAAIEYVDNAYVITDLGSRNGTFVNHRKIRSGALSHGDTITIGECELRFRFAQQEEHELEALRLLTIPADNLKHGRFGSRGGYSATFGR